MDQWNAREVQGAGITTGTDRWGIQDSVIGTEDTAFGTQFLGVPEQEGPYRSGPLTQGTDGEDMDLYFQSVSEKKPGDKWQTLFERYWPAYRAWYLSDGLEQRATWLTCKEALEAHMPRLLPTYDCLCDLAGGGDLAARFLSLWRPPA
ncbi:MAG TPA: hypothetical protein DCG04_01115, partial [Rhodospirillaceae bacterium]|nr:hypothetical protein [Rhodospirillaceae bacterium]